MGLTLVKGGTYMPKGEGGGCWWFSFLIINYKMNDNKDDMQLQEFSNSEDEVLLVTIISVGRNSTEEKKGDRIEGSIMKEDMVVKASW
jgi:hypothetical protein